MVSIDVSIVFLLMQDLNLWTCKLEGIVRRVHRAIVSTSATLFASHSSQHLMNMTCGLYCLGSKRKLRGTAMSNTVSILQSHQGICLGVSFLLC